MKRFSRVKSNAYSPMSTNPVGQNLIYNQMSHHYRRLYNTKSRVDSSPPRCLRQQHGCSNRPGSTQLGGSPTATELALVDLIINDTKQGPNAFSSQLRDCNWTEDDYRGRRVPAACTAHQCAPNKTSAARNTRATADIIERHSNNFVSPEREFKPRILKSSAQSRVRDLKVYHPPRRRPQKRQRQQQQQTGAQEDWRQDEQVDDGVSSGSSAEPWLQMPLYVKCPCSTAVQKPSSAESSRDSAYNGGVSSGGESRGPTPEQSPDKPAVAPSRVSAAKEARLNKQKEEALYVQFVHDITQDVLTSGIFSNKGLRQVFQRHIGLNKDRLNMDRMKVEIARLQLQLDVPGDDEDAHTIQSQSSKAQHNDISVGSMTYCELQQYCMDNNGKTKMIDSNITMTESEIIRMLIEMGFSPNMAKEICHTLSDKDLPLTTELCNGFPDPGVPVTPGPKDRATSWTVQVAENLLWEEVAEAEEDKDEGEGEAPGSTGFPTQAAQQSFICSTKSEGVRFASSETSDGLHFTSSKQSNGLCFTSSKQSNGLCFTSSKQSNAPSFTRLKQSNELCITSSKQSDAPSLTSSKQSNAPSFTSSKKSHGLPSGGSTLSDRVGLTRSTPSERTSVSSPKKSQTPSSTSVRSSEVVMSVQNESKTSFKASSSVPAVQLDTVMMIDCNTEDLEQTNSSSDELKSSDTLKATASTVEGEHSERELIRKVASSATGLEDDETDTRDGGTRPCVSEDICSCESGNGDTISEIVREVTISVINDIARGMEDSVSSETAGEMEVPNEVSGEMEVSNEVSEEVEEEVSNEVADKVQEKEVSSEVADEVEEVSDDVADAVEEDASSEVAGEMEDEVSRETEENITEELSQKEELSDNSDSSSESSISFLAERLKEFTVDKSALQNNLPHDETDMLSREELRARKSS